MFGKLLPIFIASVALPVSAANAALEAAVPVETLPCNPISAFGQSFGSNSINGQIEIRGVNSVVFKPRESWSPFATFEAVISANTGISGVTGVAYFTSRSSAKEQSEKLIESFKDKIKVVDIRIGRLGETYLYTGEKVKELAVSGKSQIYHVNGLEVKISAIDRSVYLSCEDLGLQIKHIQSALQK